jgi:phage tail-like protein
MAVKFAREALKGTTKTQGDFNLTSRFNVEIDGVTIGGIHNVQGLDTEHDTVEYQDGDDHFTHYRPGRSKTGIIKIEKDWSSTDEFYKWFSTVMAGKVERKSVSFVFLNDAGEEASRINLFDAWPKKWSIQGINSRTSGHASETLEIVYERMEMKP